VTTPNHTILDLERQLAEHADEMMRLSRAHARGENVAAEKMRVQAAIDVVTALIGGLRRSNS
jgi:hypothetical protein